MKSLAIATLLTAIAATLAYLAIGPAGALYTHPLACVGVGLIGLGLCKHFHDRRPASVPAETPCTPDAAADR